jgi:hypothetical protein
MGMGSLRSLRAKRNFIDKSNWIFLPEFFVDLYSKIEICYELTSTHTGETFKVLVSRREFVVQDNDKGILSVGDCFWSTIPIEMLGPYISSPPGYENVHLYAEARWKNQDTRMISFDKISLYTGDFCYGSNYVSVPYYLPTEHSIILSSVIGKDFKTWEV